MKTIITLLIICICMSISCTALQEPKNSQERTFNSKKDLLSLHYDHAPDKDDGHSAAADRTILQSIYGKDWIKKHVIAVSGAYGKNAGNFNPNADAVMDAAWNDCGGWLAAHTSRNDAITKMTQRWTKTLKAGGDIWIKEGGQSDLTAAVVERIREQLPKIDTTAHIHTVQHSNWNEDQTTEAALAYTKSNTHYIRIKDANTYLNIRGGNEAFVKAATENPVYGDIWKAAFAYYNPKERIDFSDTGELMHILGLGEMGFDKFIESYLK
ncbi:MAG: hypothetical protein JW787_15475 [Sedimentisphaerales bacterium]|nr:hypothetical protein [Sedimentisphaerales bacterium]